MGMQNAAAFPSTHTRLPAASADFHAHDLVLEDARSNGSVCALVRGLGVSVLRCAVKAVPDLERKKNGYIK